MRSAGLAVVLLCLACGSREESTRRVSTPESGPSFLSGDRLRARSLDGGDGAVALVEWHDTLLDIACTFRLASDGKYRCLPTSGYPAESISFLDTSCTIPVVLSTKTEIMPYALYSPATLSECTGADDRYPVRRVGQVVTDPELTLSNLDVTGNCSTSTSPLVPSESGLTVYTLEEEVPPTEFLAAERVPSENGARLAPIHFHAEDGSRERAGVWDHDRKRECFVLWGDGAPCVPEVVAWHNANVFGDAACTKATAYVSSATPLGTETTADCAPPEVAVEFPKSYCGKLSYQLFEVGASVDETYLSDGAGNCAAFDEPRHADYSVGPELPPEFFATTELRRIGTDRITLEVSAAHDGARLDFGMTQFYGPSRFRDETLGVACDPKEACDGVRCDPGAWSGLFADPGCTERIVELSPGGCEDTEPKYFSLREGDACWDGALLQIGDVVSSPNVYTKPSETECVAHAATTGSVQYRLIPASVDAAPIVDRVE